MKKLAKLYIGHHLQVDSRIPKLSNEMIEIVISRGTARAI